MFEAVFKTAAVLKKVLDAIKEVVADATFDCSYTGIEVQFFTEFKMIMIFLRCWISIFCSFYQLEGLGNSHVAFVALKLKTDGFAKFRCDRNLALSMKLESLAKVLKCANNDDILLMTAQDNGDVVTFEMESPSQDEVLNAESSLFFLQLLTFHCIDCFGANRFPFVH